MAQEQQTMTLPGQWETNAAVLASVSNMVRFNLRDNYYVTYADNVRKQSTARLASAAKEVVRPANMLWVIIGDRGAIEAGIRELKLGDLTIIEGNEVKPRVHEQVIAQRP